MKIYPANIEAVSGTRLMDDGTLSIELRMKNGHATRLNMDFKVASAVIDSIAALNDEAMAKMAPKVWGMKAAAFRNCNNVAVKLDVNKTALLIDFDEHAPHRVGVAVPIDLAPKFIQILQAKMAEVK